MRSTRLADHILGTFKISVGSVKFASPLEAGYSKASSVEQKERGRRGISASLESVRLADSLELPSVAEELAQSAAAGLPSGIWLVLDEVAEEKVRSLRFELLEPERVGIEGTAGERRGELIGNKVVDECVVVLLGTGVVRVG